MIKTAREWLRRHGWDLTLILVAAAVAKVVNQLW